MEVTKGEGFKGGQRKKNLSVWNLPVGLLRFQRAQVFGQDIKRYEVTRDLVSDT